MSINYDLKNIPLRVLKTLNKCLEQAKKSQMHSKHCACLEKDGRIHIFSLNDYCNISYSRINKFSYHAEEKLLHNFEKKGRKKYNLYIVRVSLSGELINSKPCKDCVKIIKNHSSFISNVIYPGKNKIEIKKPNEIYSNHLSVGNRAKQRYLIDKNN